MSQKTPALLVLADGSVFRGTSIGAPGRTVGEVVFNTSMTGYQEILTDPSYAGQVVTLTYPHIGNTGANAEDVESRGVFAAGLVIRDLPLLASNWRMQETLPAYLERVGLYRDLNAAVLHLAPQVLADLLVGELTRAGAVRIDGDHLAAA